MPELYFIDDFLDHAMDAVIDSYVQGDKEPSNPIIKICFENTKFGSPMRLPAARLCRYRIFTNNVNTVDDVSSMVYSCPEVAKQTIILM
jgi:hypothetical protein